MRNAHPLLLSTHYSALITQHYHRMPLTPAPRLRSRRRKGVAILVVSALAVLLAAAFFMGPTQYHSLVVFEVTEHFEITFLQNGTPKRQQCEAVIQRMTDVIAKNCAICRVREKRCLDKLDPLQQKILHGRPVDIPVMRVPTGVIAFKASGPEIAMQACQETERKGSPALGQGRCAPPGFESLALSLAKMGNSGKPAAGPDLRVMLGIPLIALAIAFAACWLIVRSQALHGRFTYDQIDTGPQKFHATPTPRIGGIALALALGGAIAALGTVQWISSEASDGLAMLALAAIPAFAGGLGEDLTRRVGVLARLMLTISSGVIASLLIGATLDRVDVPGFDALLQWPIFAIAFTAFAVGGVANAINIIDGYNGLVGGYAVLVLAAFAWVAFNVGDPVVLSASLTMAGALLGFLIWNYPKGKIFFGDGGAYLLGFWLAELSVLLVARNPEVSPWFPLALLAYPIIETLFSFYRKTLLRGHSAGHPDGLHFHMLIYKRLVRHHVVAKDPAELAHQNSAVAPLIWAGNALFILPALFFWRSTPGAILVTLAIGIGYLWLYSRLVNWRAPAWLIRSQRRIGHHRAETQ